MPAVGDWVAVCDAPGGARRDRGRPARAARRSRGRRRGSRPRSTSSSRTSTRCCSSRASTADFNPRRLERYLVAAWDSGADPVLVLTKLDLCDDPAKLAEAEAVAIGVPVLAVSNVTGEGIDERAGAPSPARARSSSSVRRASGKSTLVNRLAGRRLMPTGDLRRDGRGRHTTRHRQLLVLPGGALLVDTPGLRELQVWEGDVDSAFSDIAELAARVPLQRLRAPDRARLRGAGGARERRARPRALRRATASSSASCGRSRSARASGCSARRSSAGGSARGRAGPPVATRTESSSAGAQCGAEGNAIAAARSRSCSTTASCAFARSISCGKSIRLSWRLSSGQARSTGRAWRGSRTPASRARAPC